jgi:hypothetical protein
MVITFTSEIKSSVDRVRWHRRIGMDGCRSLYRSLPVQDTEYARLVDNISSEQSSLAP